MKTFVVGTHQKYLAKALLLITYNICFCGGIRKQLSRYTSYLKLCITINPFTPSKWTLLPNSVDQCISKKRGVWVVLILSRFIEIFLYYMQTVQTLIRCRILRRLIWVYTVCLCLFYGTLGLNGLISVLPN